MRDFSDPKVGVAVCIIRDGKILMGKRIASHGTGTWQFPGGHLEKGESLEECAKRETEEETGLIADGFKLLYTTNDIYHDLDKHYVTLFLVAQSSEGTPEVKEPEKCSEWDWFDWNELPEPLFKPIINLIKAGETPFKLAA